MPSHPLKILKNTSHSLASAPQNGASARWQENALRMEREWEQDPSQFAPEKTAIGRQRIKRTWEVILGSCCPLPEKGLDMGCGEGVFGRRLQAAGLKITMADIAKKALTPFDPQKFEVVQEALPKTSFPDDSFGLVVCTDVIAYLFPQDFRLALSELSRILQRDGYIVCSTPLDFRNEGALEQFISLVETEFKPIAWVFSYHALYLRCLSMLQAPARFAKAAQDPAFRKKEELEKRSSVRRKIWRWQTSKPLGVIWKGVASLLNPFLHLWEQSPFILNGCERICRLLNGDRGISHAIFVAHRKPLLPSYPKTSLPERAPFKKERKWE